MNLIENRTGKKIKRLRTDNGLEYVDGEFTELFKEHGIARHKTVRKTPRQNEIVERMNKTIPEKVRCMLHFANLGKQFCGEAVNSAMYLINRRPSTALEFKAHKEIWT